MMVMIAACGASAMAPPVAPRPTRASLDAKAVAWSERDPKAAVVPADVRRLQLVITRGRTESERFAWLVSNGTDVIRVYHTTTVEVGELVGTVIRTVYPTGGSPIDKLDWTITGSVHAPGPTPPGPPGFPGDYVEQVMNLAWAINHQQQIQHQASGAAVP